MRRSLPTLICLALLGACTIQETPQHYIDRRDPLPDQIAASEDELTNRLRDIPRALQGASDSALLSVLRPEADVVVLSSDRSEAAAGEMELARALRSAAGATPPSTASVSLRVGPNNQASWFTAVYARPSGESLPVFFSGVFVRSDGEWRLVQSHVSEAVIRPDPGPASTRDTSGAAE